ncbi:hypothetical protein [Rhizobium sp. RAF56]|uniref:hypothetical protein n=1 Tax=Rhizobium sp. RAF56 TaxID=3233062 RepID=UPI003F9CAFF8
MYASVTDYSAVYNDAYRLRRGQHTSFDRNVLPPLVAEFCKGFTCTRLLDVSGGSGGLGRELKKYGIETTTTDFGSLPNSNVINFNLSDFGRDQLDRVLRAVDPARGPYLTTCFDVLEHIDREHVARAVHNLAILTNRFLVVSISTRPSAFDNLLHATLMPIPTWTRAFEAAGLRLMQRNAFASGTTRKSFPTTDEHRLIHRWIASDLFSDAEAGEPIYLVFEKKETTGAFSDIQPAIDFIVDVAYRKTKRVQFGSNNGRRFNFNIHHAQEWSLLRPLLDVIPRKNCRFLIRPEFIFPDIFRAIRSFLARTGVEVVEYSDVGELPWHDLKGELLISGAESSVGWGHLQSHETVAVARLHGCHTYLLQHGVWPRSFAGRILTFASERVLTWGREDERRLNDRKHKIFEAEVPWGVFPPEQAFPIGSPKFSDQLIGPYPGLAARLGFDASSYDRTILVGTKNLRERWGIDNISDRFLGELESAITRNERTLFLIRPHPADSAETFAAVRNTNVRILDELAGVLSDTPLARVMPYVDMVVTSPSSLVVDAAVSDKPVFVYDTGQPIEFDKMQAAPFQQFEDQTGIEDELCRLREVSRDLKSRYSEAVDDSFYSKFANLLRAEQTSKLDSFTAASASLALQAVENARALTLTRSEAKLGSLTMEMEEKERDWIQLTDRLKQNLEASSLRELELLEQNAAILNSSSWRLTRPLRQVAEVLRMRVFPRLLKK